MVRLKKYRLFRLKASSLVETLLATVILMIVFGIAMMTVGNLLENNIKSNTSAIDKELNKLVYLYKNGQIQIPDNRVFKEWMIVVKQVKEGDVTFVLFEAKQKQTKKMRTQKMIAP